MARRFTAPLRDTILYDAGDYERLLRFGYLSTPPFLVARGSPMLNVLPDGSK